MFMATSRHTLYRNVLIARMLSESRSSDANSKEAIIAYVSGVLKHSEKHEGA